MTLELSGAHLNQLLTLLRQVPTFDGDNKSLSTFIKRIDYIMQLYPTRDVKQPSVMFGTIEMQLTGEAQKVCHLTQPGNWPNLRATVISEFRLTHLVKNCYDAYIHITNFTGNFR